MEGQSIKLEKVLLYILIILFSVGVIGHSIDSLKSIMLLLTPYVLLLSSSFLIYILLNNYKIKNIIWLITVFILTLVVEIIGVKTGSIFGNYYYGEVLGFKIFEVPIIIGVNWVMVLAGSIVISEYLSISKYYRILTVGFLALLFDFVLEPVAMQLGYWNWADNVIPVQNYAAWFVIAVISAFIYSILKAEISNKLFLKYYIIQLAFFLLLNIFL